MRVVSGCFCVMELAMVCKSIVLPVRGGSTIRPRCPLPRRDEVYHASCEIFLCRLIPIAHPGKAASVIEKTFRRFAGSFKLMASTLMSAKYRSHSLGGRICPATVSPVRNRTCESAKVT